MIMIKGEQEVAKKELTPAEIAKLQQERVELAGIILTGSALKEYLGKPDDLGINEDIDVPVGYKRCGKCRRIQKYYLFNKNSEAKEKCSGSCKVCQKANAKKSYTKTKQKRNYKKYYQENKEKKLEHSKAYYKENKEKLNAAHAKYVQSKKGKAVMKKAREKRAAGLANVGIPYTADQVWERDLMIEQQNGKPVCYLCGKVMDDMKKCHMDHVIGIAIGGPNSFENVAYVHNTCNLTKTKDCREVTPDITERINLATEQYIDEHPEDFK